ncbi:hypothetical protein M422DRAFT_160499, partial [Sphaerobolus stellatus SS14]
ATKTLNGGIAELFDMAKDTKPVKIPLQMILLCENQNIRGVSVPPKIMLGRPYRFSRHVMSASITTCETTELANQIETIKERHGVSVMMSSFYTFDIFLSNCQPIFSYNLSSGMVICTYKALHCDKVLSEYVHRRNRLCISPSDSAENNENISVYLNNLGKLR